MEMGATWFGPQHQYLQQLMQELKIDRFHQWQGWLCHDKGTGRNRAICPSITGRSVFSHCRRQQRVNLYTGGCYWQSSFTHGNHHTKYFR
ncbi:MAG: hypothetical protein GTN52_13650 [Hydrotalea flava]|nr:hypothetical protein [Hydrotalea flava]